MEEFALRTFGLTKKFGGKMVLNNVSMNIRKGDIYGFIGPNGAGKTTAMKIILDLLKPTSGEVELFGSMRTSGSLSRVGSLIESPGLYTGCSAIENMKRFSIICGGTDKDILFYLRMVGLEGVGNKKVGAFSLGMKQRLGIAQALLNKPKLLICDEPTSALDPLGRKEILDALVAAKEETTIIFSTHILSDVEHICDEMALLDNGKIVMKGTIEEVKKKRRGTAGSPPML